MTMAMQQEMRMGTGFQIDNFTYHLVTLVHEKSKGLEAFDSYIRDARTIQRCRDLFQQIRQQDQQAVQQLVQALKLELGSS
jgi:hypothetical protein